MIRTKKPVRLPTRGSINVRELRGIIHEAWVAGAEELDLHNQVFSELPPEVGQLTKLKKLDLSGWSDEAKMLTKLPAEIGQLASLEELYLSQNELTALPESLGNLARI